MKFATIVKCTTFCAYIVVVAILLTDSVFAQEPSAEPGSPRYEAIHNCSTEVEKWSDRDWETTKAARYGACMTNHGEVQ
jgi:hypothetical protein